MTHPPDPTGRMPRRAFLTGMSIVAVGACAPSQVPPARSAPALAPIQPAGSPPAPTATGSATELVRAASPRPEVALTFHGAGDPGLASRVLGCLADRGAAATVLAVGQWLQQYPDVPKMISDYGHELGNHTWSHPDLAMMDEAEVRVEIERCRDRIAAATGGPGAFFRPSAAQHATDMVLRGAAAAGYPRVLSYDVDSRDFTDPGAAAIRRNVATGAAGSVVSMHLGHPGTLAALSGVLDDLAARGLRPVTASRLFG